MSTALSCSPSSTALVVLSGRIVSATGIVAAGFKRAAGRGGLEWYYTQNSPPILLFLGSISIDGSMIILKKAVDDGEEVYLPDLQVKCASHGSIGFALFSRTLGIKIFTFLYASVLVLFVRFYRARWSSATCPSTRRRLYCCPCHCCRFQVPLARPQVAHLYWRQIRRKYLSSVIWQE